jgi:hypothetical protein
MTVKDEIRKILETDRDLQQKERDRLLDFSSETRQRVDTFIKALLVLAGGALTVSIGVFLRPDAPYLDSGQALYLRRAWGLIFYSLAAEASLMAVMIVQGYWESSTWLKGARSRRERGLRLLVQVVNWFLGASGFLAFLVGLGFLAYVSATAITSQPRGGGSAIAAHAEAPR